MAMLETSKYIDTLANRPKVAKTIAGKSYVNCPVSVIEGRMKGEYEDGLGKKWKDANYMKFYDDGQVNFPYPSHGVWFLTQFRRWGLLKADVDYAATAQQVNQTAIYSEAAKAVGVPVPATAMKTEKLFDGIVFDPAQAVAYAQGFKVKVA
jgi:nitrate/nitrite transport system substrate-binding protein